MEKENIENIENIGKKLEFLLKHNPRDFGYVEAILDTKYKSNIVIATNYKYEQKTYE